MIAVLALAWAQAGPSDVGFDPRLGESVPLDVELTEGEAQVSLRKVLGGKPGLLALVYYRCPLVCGEVLGGLARAFGVLGLVPGREFEAVVVSIDPREPPGLAAEKKARYQRRPGEAWRFLTGSEEAIRRIAGAVGFRYAYDARSDQYAHAAGVVILTPDGRVSSFFPGIDYPPRDLRLALVEAGGGRLGNLRDRVLLVCFRYDPSRGRYSLSVLAAVRGLGVLTALALGFGVGLMAFRERRRRTGEP
ncbi:MAG TPA: SCO family protein [Planctomycetota bacterium]|jgi:protein SCO1/2|nr:SCO family protein [Planctomycetota bacterium]